MKKESLTLQELCHLSESNMSRCLAPEVDLFERCLPSLP